MVMDLDDVLGTRATQLEAAIEGLRPHAATVSLIGQQLAHRLHGGGRIYAAGNGGAAALAQHFCAEFQGRLTKDRVRRPLGAHSLVSDSVTLTALANDFGFENAMARALDAFGKKGDALVILSTSGKSQNLLTAARRAAELGVYRIALLGLDQSPLDDCEVALHVENDDPGAVQECHLLLLHAIADVAERHLLTACGGAGRREG